MPALPKRKINIKKGGASCWEEKAVAFMKGQKGGDNKVLFMAMPFWNKWWEVIVMVQV